MGCSRKNIIINGGIKDQYDQMFKGEEDKERILEYSIVELANESIRRQENNGLERYDAILVDEGQDFNPFWWTTLRRVLKDGGEMLLVADETQDLYERAKSWTEEEMLKAGFRGPWSQLDICYRTPNKLINHLKDFLTAFLPDAKIKLLNPESDELELFPVTLTWIQTKLEQEVPQSCVTATLDIPKLANPNAVAFPDLTLLVPDHRIGLDCVRLFGENNFNNVLHIFDQDSQERKPKKMKFFMGAAQIKACTIHSFKGWEARYMVVAITKSTDLAAAYVAMSRLKRHPNGSYLTVVCSNPELEEYGKTWSPDNKSDPEVKKSMIDRLKEDQQKTLQEFLNS